VPGTAAVAARQAPAAGAALVTNPAGLVNPLIGTAHEADDFPGADVPFGMVQWSPDTTSQPDGGGYDYGDSKITGFSLTHLAGVGCKAEGDIPVLPTVGKLNTKATDRFRHTAETAAAGYYKVGLQGGMTTELTATTRTGMARFSFPSTARAHLVFKLNGSQKPDTATSFHVVSGTEVRGSVSTGAFCQSGNSYTVYFDMRFSQRFSSHGTFTRAGVRRSANDLVLAGGSPARGGAISRSAPEAPDHPVYHGQLPPGQGVAPALRGPAGAYLTFRTTRGKPVLAKVGLSYTSAAGAKANLTRENPNWNFAGVRSAALAAWNKQLSRIQIAGGSSAQQHIFYTALYHALQFPSVFSDVNRRYRGADHRVHTVDSGHSAFYTNISGWDIYRTQAQLEALLDPAVASDTAQSMLDVYRQTGRLPKWIEDNSEAYVMVGDPADSILADYYAFGARNFGARAALTAMIRQAARPSRIRPGGHYLAQPGYLPVDGRYACCNYYGPVPSTLEYDTADFAISALAAALGDGASHQRFLDRSQDWRNVLNPASGMVQQRLRSGRWAGKFDPTVGKAWVEADSWIYTGMVPFDLAGLTAAKGGKAAMATYLDTVLRSFTGAHGYARLSNEPSIELPWEYDYIGQPFRTQQTVRQVQVRLWANRPAGLGTGNDDLGTMSSWYVWSALGMYPMTPGTSTLALGSPLFSQAVVHLPSGAALTINGNGAGQNSPYVQSASWNGSPWNNAFAPAAAITSGGTLSYSLGASPNRSWASAPSAAPPSFPGNTVAPPQPRVGAVSTGLSTHLCMNVKDPVSKRASAVQTWTCTGTGAQQWDFGTDGTIRALGKCLDVHGGSKKNGAAVDLATCTGSGAQHWIGGAAGALVNTRSGHCLNVSRGSAGRGIALQASRCNKSGAQRWTLPAAPAGRAGSIGSAVTAKLCIEDKGGSTRNGTPVLVFTCNSSAAQHWTIEPDSTLRARGRCMSVHGGRTANGTVIEIDACNGTGAQQWRATTSGQLISPPSGRCLTDPNGSAKPGTRLQIRSCAGGAAQRWKLPA